MTWNEISYYLNHGTSLNYAYQSFLDSCSDLL
ncbi:hypothetical protein FB597_1143 [Herbaspirillum sp. SJZ099]|nr:hypothetical protein FB597_1143 [Herbaspirillum sp. SJZ099]